MLAQNEQSARPHERGKERRAEGGRHIYEAMHCGVQGVWG